MSDRWEMAQRERNHRSASGPAYTFSCLGCGLFKGMSGRKKVNGQWRCKACLAALIGKD